MVLNPRIKKRCLDQFSLEYPDEKKVIMIERTDGNIRVLNRRLDSMLFDSRGREILTFKYAKVPIPDAQALEATFECLEA